MKQIIAIGGGGFRRSDNNRFALERYIISQSGVQYPKIGFLPQASVENRDYIVSFYEMCTELNAKPTWISLFGVVKPGWKEQLLDQDIIYVGGGNTRSMLALWREWGLDEVLKQAYNKGIVLSGVSAGAICWFEQCITDSVWPLGVLNGLGFLEGSCCPHYDSEKDRRPTYVKKVSTGEIMPGIALSDRTASHYIDGKLKCVVTEQSNRRAFMVSADQETEVDLLDITLTD